MVGMARPGTQDGTEVVEKPKAVSKRPKLFHVVLLNDDYTTMEFVVHVLENVFDKGPAEAYRIMMEVHTRGRGVCGAYTYEVAETKVETVHEMARIEGFPLKAGIEEA
jgi:ATP-dependent Clp protease adaptor protein ClpS